MTDRGKLVAKIGAGATALAVPLVMPYEGTVLRTLTSPRRRPRRKLPLISSFSYSSLLAEWPRSSDFRLPPASVQPVIKYGRAYAMSLSYFCPRPSVRRTQNNAAIPSLHGPVGPNAILRRVAKRIVLSLNGQRIGVAVCHSPVAECLERLPLSAYGDAFAVVVHPSWMAAASSHALPCVVEALP